MPTPANGNGPLSPRPFTRDRMNVLDSSRGIDDTVAQNVRHVPSFIRVLLDVREIERGDGRPCVARVLRDRRERPRPAEIAHDRDDQVPGLKILEKPEVRLGRKVTSLPPLPVVHRHQIRVGRMLAVPALARQAIPEIRAVGKERRPVDVVDAGDVLVRERQPALFRQPLDHRGEVAAVVRVGRRQGVVCREEILDGRLGRQSGRSLARKQARRESSPGPGTSPSAPCTAGARGGCRGGCR